jgi:hypothetical protein
LADVGPQIADPGQEPGKAAGTGWSYDPTLNFDRIHIIESLSEPGRASRTGQRLFEELESLCAGTPAHVEYHPVHAKAELSALMLAIVTEAQRGHFPFVHFEAHGEKRQPGRSTTSRGMVLASGELFSWSELAPYLIEINKVTRLRLLVFVATCFGADIATLVQPLDRAPARVLIGPRDTISIEKLETGTFAFYRTLLRTLDGSQAVNDMNRATRGAFFPFTAEWLFLNIWKGYFNELTTEPAIAARVEPMIAEMALQGVPAAELARRREIMKTQLRDRKSVFESSYRRFFFIDKDPEIADRFRMTYEACFEEGTQA